MKVFPTLLSFKSVYVLTCANLLEIVSDNFISVSKLLTKLLPKLKFDEENKMVLHSMVFPTIPTGYALNSPNISNNVKLNVVLNV